MNGTHAFIKKKKPKGACLPLLSCGDPVRKCHLCGRGPLPDTKPATALILNFPASETVRN
jgi:hypothetical protein